MRFDASVTAFVSKRITTQSTCLPQLRFRLDSGCEHPP
eukprot:gene27070-biopygen17629